MAQTLTDWELIVCDSYSNDGTWEYLQQFVGDPRVKLHQVPREGVYAGWNECLRRCSGRYVYIATADDTCSPDVLARLVSALEAQQGGHVGGLPIRMAMCDFTKIRAGGEAIPRGRDVPMEFLGDWCKRGHARSGWLELLMHLHLGISWVTYTALLFERSLLDEVGFFPVDCGAMGDRLWAARSALHSAMLFLPGTLATWRVHDGQLSAKVDMDGIKRLHAALAIFVDENTKRFPAEWTRHHDWRESLLRGARRDYRLLYGLDREWLRHEPRRFLKGLGMAARHDPGYLLERLASGFSWNQPDYRDQDQVLNALLQKWQVGPPEPVEAPHDP